ncbi:hypothetical protein CO660_20515 [Rhizobium sp. L9]|nr:hypothetical protein CO660_20515 [Rhizobium sp. L9]
MARAAFMQAVSEARIYLRSECDTFERLTAIQRGGSMMGIIDEREEALEKEYIVKLERSFHIQARRDRMLARWAAELIGRTDFDVYFDEVISAGLLESGDENVFRKILSDLQYADVAISAQTVREKMKQLLLEAARSLDEAG